ncbi:MAG: aspartate aminotransferase family protein [Flavobacteriaceae bacterium]|nr:aspartate aminotransferase family protein [Flavobacteriaceae bacterium]|tara:strand:- start:10060 stop:11241 length:1182 start_codon:yes stop_codon:yes gene_type:complete
MLNDFLKYQAKTSDRPIGLEIEKAKGSFIWDKHGKKYLDFVSGVSACNIGHLHPDVIKSIKSQLNKYMHVMVYGEFAQEPAVELCKNIIKYLPENLEVIYLTNSGTEAIEGALKLSKKATGRNEIIAAYNSYHGSTHGSLSITGKKSQKKGYYPLVPGAKFINFNKEDDLSLITNKTAAVILETIQGGAGFIVPEEKYLLKIKEKCESVGALLILDEIQSGFGRTGKLFGFEHYEVVPDILVMGKAMGGGLPIGAFCSSNLLMKRFEKNPKLGHITTFGGNPLIATSALSTLKVIFKEKLMNQIYYKEKIIRQKLTHPSIIKINGKGLMLALIFKNTTIPKKLIYKCIQKGLILYWLLWDKKAVRITPPLNISLEEINKGCKIILDAIDEITN